MYTGLGVYFIQTKDTIGALMRWMWAVDYRCPRFSVALRPELAIIFHRPHHHAITPVGQ